MTNKGVTLYFGLSLNVITLFTESVGVILFGNALISDKKNWRAPCTQEVIYTIVHLLSRNQNKILIYFGTFYVFLSNIAIILISLFTPSSSLFQIC